MPNLTPMMQQYKEIKDKHNDCIVFFRLGDFYEMFFDDAVVGSKILDIALTSRHKGEHKMPMCGVPFHSAENYIAKLTKAGKKVAICEQTSDPSKPGLVEREVIRVITPGTTFNENILNQKTNNYIICIFPQKNYFGLSYADLTTGDFFLTEIEGFENLRSEFSRLNPSECIINKEIFSQNKEFELLCSSFPLMHIFHYETLKKPYEILREAYSTKTLEGFGVEKYPFGVQAAGLLFSYLTETQKQNLTHLKRIAPKKSEKYMNLDEATIRNLELICTLNEGQKSGSLFSVLDKVNTSMGARMMHYFILHPLLKKEEILYRQHGVLELAKSLEIREQLNNHLKNFNDLERTIARLSLNVGSARDLINIKVSLKKIPQIKRVLSYLNSLILSDINSNLECLDDLTSLIDRSILDEPKAILREGGMIKKGFNKELDELKDISSSGKEFISKLKEKEIKKTGINSLKIGFNKIFGYYIEITNVHKNKVPADYIRKQTLANAERYITQELKEYEEKILNAEEKMNGLEFSLFMEVREEVLKKTNEIQKIAKYIALLDVVLSFSVIAISNNYIKPEITDEKNIEIIDGRHPVLENMTFSHDFVPNSIKLTNEENFILLTGPNMSGKSTILRQCALIALMAQIGSFVPASKAVIGISDRIFTRVGAQDNLLKGQSTFMVEMQEVSNILNNATEKSLILLDEIGRGTSTYDGVSIAWSIMEFIHDKIKARTVFATHYHELISLADKLENAKNFSVKVLEKDNHVIFLYKMEQGGIDKSYGIEVARLAGLPREVLTNAKKILKELEEEVVEINIKNRLHNPNRKISNDQMKLFQENINDHPAFQTRAIASVNQAESSNKVKSMNDERKVE